MRAVIPRLLVALILFAAAGLAWREAALARRVAAAHSRLATLHFDAEDGIALDQTGFPDAMGEQVYYHPVPRGLEIKLKEKLDRLREARAQARADKARKPIA